MNPQGAIQVFTSYARQFLTSDLVKEGKDSRMLRLALYFSIVVSKTGQAIYDKIDELDLLTIDEFTGSLSEE